MKRITLLLLPLCLAVAVLAQDATVDDLVKQLGDEEYAVREDATKRLIEMGDKAVPALEKALEAEDLEVRLRAGRALRAIRGEKAEREEVREEAAPERAAPGRASNFQMFIQPGKVTVTVTETVDGKQVVKSYEAESVEALKEKYPELADRLGGFRLQVGPLDRDRFDMDRFWEEWNRDFDEDLKRWREEMRRDMERTQRWLELWRQRQPGERGGAEPDWRRDPGGALLGVRATRPSEVLDAQLQLRGQGLVIEAVERDSLAEALGVERYDVLVELNGRAIRDARDVAEALRGRKEGGKPSAKVVRKTKLVELPGAK